MKITKTKYIIEDPEEYEEFLNSIFVGLKKFERVNLDFSFKIACENNIIEIKTFSLNESVN